MEALNNKKLEIVGLYKIFDDANAKVALSEVSFDVAEGEFLSILGPSGCGKTTLLRILVGLLEPTRGKILLDGEDITYAHPSKRSMGIVFQNYALFENMTVFENVTYAALLKTPKKDKEKREKIKNKAKALLEDLGIGALLERYPSELSGGQQQRVAIARTLILNPKIMLFDEPMSALDVATRLQLRDIIKNIQAKYGTTMIYITHDQEEAFAMSDRILVMEDSKLCQIDTPRNIIDHPANDYVKHFVVDNLVKKIDSLSEFMGGAND